MDSSDSVRAIADDLLIRAKILAQLVAFAWVLFVFDTILLGGSLRNWGVRPRTFSGLISIPLSVFLHGSPEHLMNNTGVFVILGGLLMLRGIEDFTIVSLAVMLCDGLGTWLFARDSNHIGASGVIFGYLGFLLARGYFENDWLSALVTIFVGAFYAHLVLGVFPSKPNISWEGHLFGFLGGIMTARFLEVIKTSLPGGLF